MASAVSPWRMAADSSCWSSVLASHLGQEWVVLLSEGAGAGAESRSGMRKPSSLSF